jgi:hypothetical protein
MEAPDLERRRDEWISNQPPPFLKYRIACLSGARPNKNKLSGAISMPNGIKWLL